MQEIGVIEIERVQSGFIRILVCNCPLNDTPFQAYVKFSGAPVTIVKSTNPFRSPTGRLPVFKCPDGAFSDFSQVATFLRKQVRK